MSFYASVEAVDRGLDPLATNLVVADESRGDGTICLAVSPSLKALKISGRARLFEVKQRLEQIKRLTGKQIDFIIATPRMQRYLDVSAEIYGVYLMAGSFTHLRAPETRLDLGCRLLLVKKKIPSPSTKL